MIFYRALFLLIITLIASDAGVTTALALDLTGLAGPTSVSYNEKTGEYYISNTNGVLNEKDGNGFITKADNQGLVVVMQFIVSTEESELNSPTGIGLIDDLLYVADIDRVIVYDANSGKHIKTVSLEESGARFLSDVAVARDGRVFVSDLQANVIFSIDSKADDEVTVFYAGEDLDGPISMIVDADRNGLIVVTQNHGRILRVSFAGEIELLKGDGESLGGVVLDRRGDLYISSTSQGEIYKIDNNAEGSLSLFQSGLRTPGDMAYNPTNYELIVPLASDNKVMSISLK